MQVDDLEIQKLTGGSLGATFLNYLSTAIKVIYGIGQDVGGAVRRIATGKVCPL